MKFFGKKTDSEILKKNLIYRKGDADNNRELKRILIVEQKGFCAYTEKFIDGLDSAEVEHFNSSIKYRDDYYNYYSVIRAANNYKKDEEFREAIFFTTRFFQSPVDFNGRIRYTDGAYEAIDNTDKEAVDFIEFLGFNEEPLFNQRRRHIKRLSGTFHDANYSTRDQVEYFRRHNEELSFITAIENELGLDLSEFY